VLRFRHEFFTLAGLRHPRIIEVYDYGLDGPVPYYTMELLDGSDLRALGPMPMRESCRVLRDVAAALAFLRQRRLLHRDVTARNVRLTGDGRAILMDFGVRAYPLPQGARGAVRARSRLPRKERGQAQGASPRARVATAAR